MFVLLYFMMIRGPQKKQQQQNQMIESLKKNDRVQTIGGILGTVLDVKDDEVTLKIDEIDKYQRYNLWQAQSARSCRKRKNNSNCQIITL